MIVNGRISRPMVNEICEQFVKEYADEPEDTQEMLIDRINDHLGHFGLGELRAEAMEMVDDYFLT